MAIGAASHARYESDAYLTRTNDDCKIMSSSQSLREISESEAEKMETGHDGASAEMTGETIASWVTEGKGKEQLRNLQDQSMS